MNHEALAVEITNISMLGPFPLILYDPNSSHLDGGLLLLLPIQVCVMCVSLLWNVPSLKGFYSLEREEQIWVIIHELCDWVLKFRGDWSFWKGREGTLGF